jgi:small multidrug resistance pump
MGWIYLGTAILFEVAGTTAMKLSEGFTRPTPSVLLFVCYGLAFTALTLALRTVSLSVAYAIWSGVGTGLIAILAFLLFAEPITAWKLVCLALIVAGVVGLHLGGPGAHGVSP